jgi:hypothetical protein
LITRLHWLPAVLLVPACLLILQLTGLSQVVDNPTTPNGTLSEPPVPSDHLELVAANAQPIQDVNQRVALVNLLGAAFQRSNIRTLPYDQKTTFTTFGSSSSDGAWKLQDTSKGQGAYRWTAEGPGFSVINLFLKNNVLYSNQPPTALPLRLAQVRGLLFFKTTPLGPRASLRAAGASLDGVELQCALVSHPIRPRVDTGGRRWDESEYCVDPKLGNLITYSPVPGLYALFDYSKALPFHDKVIPNKFTVTQGGRAVIEGQVDSITDPPTDAALFQPSNLNAIGVGAIMTQPWRYRMTLPAADTPAGDQGTIVVLHGMQPPSGRLTDVELIDSTNPGFNSSALNFAANWGGGVPAADAEPGATPQSHEVFLTLHYVSVIGAVSGQFR